MHKKIRMLFSFIVMTCVLILLFVNCSSSETVYEIGDTGPAGGLIFYVNENDSDEWHYLEAAPGDQGSNVAWGCSGTLIDGADGTGVGAGAQNTIDIIAGCGTAGIAARLCDELELGGYSDWYLPSRDELNLLYANLSKNGLGGFDSPAPHWSSTELDAGSAYIQYLDDGSQTQSNKNNAYYSVRAIRAF